VGLTPCRKRRASVNVYASAHRPYSLAPLGVRRHMSSARPTPPQRPRSAVLQLGPDTTRPGQNMFCESGHGDRYIRSTSAVITATATSALTRSASSLARAQPAGPSVGRARVVSYGLKASPRQCTPWIVLFIRFSNRNSTSRTSPHCNGPNDKAMAYSLALVVGFAAKLAAGS